MATVQAKKPDQAPKLDANGQPYPAVSKTSLEAKQEAQLEMVNAAKSDADAPRYNKDWFFTSTRPDYRMTRLDQRQGAVHLHFVTAEELAVEILNRAGISHHVELTKPLAEALKSHLDDESVVEVNPDKSI